MPFSISSLASCTDFFDRSVCDQVWLPTAWPAATTCFMMPGSHMECLPIGKKIARVQCAASAASTAGVWRGQGPSSNVSTTSPGCRKSWLLKCSKPKPGPPRVSTSTTRATPSALGLPGQDTAGAGGGGAAAGRAGACAKLCTGARCSGTTACGSGKIGLGLTADASVTGAVDTVVTGEGDKGTGSTARAVAALADGPNEPGS